LIKSNVLPQFFAVLLTPVSSEALAREFSWGLGYGSSYKITTVLGYPTCGRLSWLPVSFLLHVKYTLSYHIVMVKTAWSCSH